MHTTFNLPIDVVDQLMDEAKAEARAACGGTQPWPDDIIRVFRRKAAEYWMAADRTLH